MTATVHCKECGAPMHPQPDGRILGCPYCGAQAQLAVDGESLAAGLKLDLSNTEAFLLGLANSLHGHFGERTKLHVDGDRIMLFEINLDPDMFIARREHHGVIAQHKKMVRGVALKTATHPLDRWVQLLAKALAAYANENARVAQVLAQLRSH